MDVFIYLFIFVLWNVRKTNANSVTSHGSCILRVSIPQPPLEGVTTEVVSQPIRFPFSAATDAGGGGCVPFTTSIHFRRAALTSPKKEMKHVGGNCESSGRGYLAVFHRSWASRNGYWGGGKHNTNAAGAAVIIRKRAWLHSLTPPAL